MPSSTSSSDASAVSSDIPHADWSRALWAALLVAIAVMGAIELGLRARGYSPTVQDSPELWSLHRRQASNTSDRHLILIGASRVQLDLDLRVLREETGLHPIQLAIDGGSFVPVLSDLAADPSMRSSILVDYVDHVLEGPGFDALAAEWVALHRSRPQPWEAPSLATETWLGHAVRSRLASFADGATAMTSLVSRLISPNRTEQYLRTQPDRSRLADYSRVRMPEFAISRAAHHIGRADLAGEQIIILERQSRIAAAIADTAPTQLSDTILRRIDAVARDVETIQARGGRVVFVRFPTSGAILAYDQRRFPASIMQTFRDRVPAPVLSFEEHVTLTGFDCPDGSHLDQRDRARFTRALARELAATGALATPSPP